MTQDTHLAAYTRIPKSSKADKIPKLSANDARRSRNVPWPRCKSIPRRRWAANFSTAKKWNRPEANSEQGFETVSWQIPARIGLEPELRRKLRGRNRIGLTTMSEKSL